MKASLGSFRGFRLTAVQESAGCTGTAVRSLDDEHPGATVTLSVNADTLEQLVARLRTRVEQWSRAEKADDEAAVGIPIVRE